MIIKSFFKKDGIMLSNKEASYLLTNYYDYHEYYNKFFSYKTIFLKLGYDTDFYFDKNPTFPYQYFTIQKE